jgi:hypothetical protein
MIRILCDAATLAVGERIQAAIAAAMPSQIKIERVTEETRWQGPTDWDDILIVTFGEAPLTDSGRRFVDDFRTAHAVVDPETDEKAPSGFVLPVSIQPGRHAPPEPLSGLKSLSYDESPAAMGVLVDRIAVLTGLMMVPRDHRLFISYRASDGKTIAQDLYRRLAAAGFSPWLDEAKDNLPLGSDVQATLRKQLKHAALILVVDTPDTASSKWMRIEIDFALGNLIPLLPLVVGNTNQSRFLPLRGLERRVRIQPGAIAPATPLTDVEWENVRTEIEQFLLQVYRRRMKLEARAREIFARKGFDWVDAGFGTRFYRSHKARTSLPGWQILSHCFIQDVTDVHALDACQSLCQSFNDIAQMNHKLCIYDRDHVLTDLEIEDLNREVSPLFLAMVHHNQLECLIDSNFAMMT